LIFDILHDKKEIIEARFGEPLEWEKLPEKGMSRIKYELKGVSIFNEENWSQMIDFMVKYVPKFEAAFKEEIQSLGRR
jgi:hypothetical protein